MSTERAARPPIRRRDADPAVTDALTTTAPQCVDHDSYAHHTTAPPENGHLLLAHLAAVEDRLALGDEGLGGLSMVLGLTTVDVVGGLEIEAVVEVTVHRSVEVLSLIHI